MKNYISSRGVLTALEGVIRMVVFLLYIGLISRMKDIQRTFMYHGAEHKCINCIEHGMPLTVENVRKAPDSTSAAGQVFSFCYDRQYYFLLFITAESQVLKVGIRIALMPVIAGVSYEIIRLAGSSENPLVNVLSKPGMWVQMMTTKEPDDSMIEVAIRAVEEVFDWKAYLEENFSKTEESFGETSVHRRNVPYDLEGSLEKRSAELTKAGVEEYDLDAWYLLEHVTGITKASYYMEPEHPMHDQEEREYLELIRKRSTRIPLQHLTGVQEFMGLEFLVNEHVLIPRQDTEVLVETALDVCRKEQMGEIRLLDMCTGSGCILLSLLHELKPRTVTGVGVDLSKKRCVWQRKMLRS